MRSSSKSDSELDTKEVRAAAANVAEGPCRCSGPAAIGVGGRIAIVRGMRANGFNVETNVKWLLLAHRSGAKIYECRASGGPVTLLREISNPGGRKQNHEIVTDDKGSRYSSASGRTNAGVGYSPTPSHQRKHGLDPHEEAVEVVADHFARDLCRVLYEGRTRGNFDHLIMVAEPGFLGKLRTFLDKETDKRILTSINHNWTDLPIKEMREKLEGVLRETWRAA